MAAPFTNTNDDGNNLISDVDYRLIGLSPQYWSYTLLLIVDLIGLPLINGVDCFVAPFRDSESNANGGYSCDNAEMNVDNEDDECSHDNRPNRDYDSASWRILPLSRVLLRGIATAIDRRPNGCTLIVLDDGTGSIDCRYWDNDSGADSAFNLPDLLPDHKNTSECRGFRFAVGDSLEVMGKIKALTAGSTSSETCKLSNSSAIPLEVRHGCVREVHANSVCLIGEGQTRMANQWNGEVCHWLKCMNFSRTLTSQCKANCDSENFVRSGKDVLPLLGETITSSILGGGGISDYSNFDKTKGNSNVLQRKCCQTPYRFRKALFYCHCEATLEALDPNFRFRDTVLNRLLDMEDQLQRSSGSCHASATVDCMDLFGAQSDLPPPLLFTFEAIHRDEELSSVAKEVVASTSLPDANAQRLLRKTFAAMTNNGILSLYDPKKDLYLLVSRARVLEPFLRKSMGKNNGGGFKGVGSHVPPPFFIRSVPKRRIAEVRNWIEGGTESR